MRDKTEGPTAVSCSVEEYADMSGLSTETVRRYLKAGKLPYDQPGGPRHRILIPLSALPAGANGSARVNPEGSPISHSPADQFEQPQSRERLPGPKPRWARKRPAAFANESRVEHAKETQ
jgi:hypothetical protein